LTFNFVKINPFQVENLPSTLFLKTVRLPSVTLYNTYNNGVFMFDAGELMLFKLRR